MYPINVAKNTCTYLYSANCNQIENHICLPNTKNKQDICTVNNYSRARYNYYEMHVFFDDIELIKELTPDRIKVNRLLWFSIKHDSANIANHLIKNFFEKYSA